LRKACQTMSGRVLAPSEVLREAEEYWQLHRSLETSIREGFVALSGARLQIRSASAPFTPMTWPPSSKALLTVSSVRSCSVSTSEGPDDDWVRAWLGGARPSPEVFAAREAFREVLRKALALSNISEKIKRSQN
jgi:hypothetical protein